MNMPTRKLRYVCTICHRDAGRRRVVTDDKTGNTLGPVCESDDCQRELQAKLASR